MVLRVTMGAGSVAPMPTPTERPGRSVAAANFRISIELDSRDIIPGEHGGDFETDDVLITYTRRMERIGAPSEADSGWVFDARVSGARVAKRTNPDGSRRRLRSFGQATFLEGRDEIPDWLGVLIKKYDPENT